MKRRLTGEKKGKAQTDWDAPDFDIKKDLTLEQRAEVGSVILAWSEIEISINIVLSFALFIDFDIAKDVFTRINGFEGKRELIIKALKVHPHLPKGVWEKAQETLAAASEVKKIRDALAHASTFYRNPSMALGIESRGMVYEVLLDLGALQQLYERMVAVKSEVSALSRILFHTNQQVIFNRYRDKTTLPIPDLLRNYIDNLEKAQALRRGLPPLPNIDE